MEQKARNNIFSTVAASAIFLSSVGAVPLSFVEPAFAAAPATVPSSSKAAPVKETKPIVTTKTKSVAEPVDPLATQKANAETAKKQLTSASAELTQAKLLVSSANTAYAKASASVDSAQKKVVSDKKALIAANDKLADARAREGAGNGGALKEVESLAIKVGECVFLKLIND